MNNRKVLVLLGDKCPPWSRPTAVTQEGMHVYSSFDTEYEIVKIIYWLIKAKGHKRILEIGTNRGFTTWWLAKAAEEIGGLVTTVDPVDNWEAGDLATVTRVKMKSEDYFKIMKPEEQFDFIFVDGDHSFLPALADLVLSESRIAKGGTIAVHDTSYTTPVVCELPKVLLEFIPKSRGEWMQYYCGAGLAVGEF